VKVFGLELSFAFGCREVSLAKLFLQHFSVCQHSLLALMELHAMKCALVAAWLLHRKHPKHTQISSCHHLLDVPVGTVCILFPVWDQNCRCKRPYFILPGSARTV